MHKLLLATSLLLSSSAFADDINLIARASDINARAGRNVSVETFHSALVKNTSGVRKDYKFTWCIFIENTNGKKSCYYKRFNLKNGEQYKDHYSNIMYLVDVKKGVYKIVAESFVADQKVEGNAILTVM